jgi:fructoselysine-6-P-deglycase FrlB-like protein
LAGFVRASAVMPLLGSPWNEDADCMMCLLVFFVMLAILSIAALWNKIPDTHREVSQHGHFNF